MDVDEWGQIAIVNLLTRYARTQFVDPTHGSSAAEQTPFYSDSSDSASDDGSGDGDGDAESDAAASAKAAEAVPMDPDHRLLLRSALPLLHSRNPGVVMAVAQLYNYCAPHAEVQVVVKPMLRMLTMYREIQHVVLNTIVGMATQRRGMFEPYLKHFFVLQTDPTFVRLLKVRSLAARFCMACASHPVPSSKS